jgi:hypothetical protein
MAPAKLARWALGLVGAALVVWVASWFAVFALVLRPFGTTPFSMDFLAGNPGWVVLFLIGVALIGIALALFIGAAGRAKAERLRRATDAF